MKKFPLNFLLSYGKRLVVCSKKKIESFRTFNFEGSQHFSLQTESYSHYVHNIAHEIEHIFTIQSQHKIIYETILKHH